MLQPVPDTLGPQLANKGRPRTSLMTRENSETLPPGISIASFSEGYRKFFEVVPATTDQLRWHNYHLRHEVYARELAWEPIRDDEIETDAYDRHAVHCLMRAVATHTFVGCGRLVRPDPENSAAPLPFETVCATSLDRNLIDPARLDRSRIAEISRLAVIGQYRRRPGEAGTAFTIDDDFGIAPRIRLPYLTLGLYLALIALARWHKIDTLFVVADQALIRNLAHLGIDIRQIGTEVEHRGQRIPGVIDVDKIVTGMAPYLRPFFGTIADEISRSMQSAS
jgi:N-acyl amino acid synthase of PEP-CTERM/exosortase system